MSLNGELTWIEFYTKQAQYIIVQWNLTIFQLVCDNMGELYRNCDLDTVVNFLAKQVSYSCLEEEHKRPFDWPSSFQNVSKLTESNPKAMREELMQQCATILACYRLLVCFNRTMSWWQFFSTGKTAQAQVALDSWSCLSAWSCCLCTPTVSWRATPSLAAGWSTIKACNGFSSFFLL